MKDKLTIANDVQIQAITNDDVLEMGDIPGELPVAYLLPSASGPGLCSLALSDFLSCQQNKLLELCSKQKLKFSGLEQNVTISKWQFHMLCTIYHKHCKLHAVSKLFLSHAGSTING